LEIKFHSSGEKRCYLKTFCLKEELKIVEWLNSNVNENRKTEYVGI
jgi:hypothetical protein